MITFPYQNRWLLVEFIPDTSTSGHNNSLASMTRPRDTISSKDLFNALKQSVLRHVGWREVGSSLAGVIFFFFHPSSTSRLSFYEGPIFFFLFGWRGSHIFPYDEPLHDTRCARHCNKQDLGGVRVAGHSRRGWRWRCIRAQGRPTCNLYLWCVFISYPGFSC